MIVKPNSTGISAYFVLRNNITHLPAPYISLDSFGAVYVIDKQEAVNITISELDNENSQWSSGGVVAVAAGLYRIDLPDIWNLPDGTRVQIIIGGTDFDTVFFEIEVVDIQKQVASTYTAPDNTSIASIKSAIDTNLDAKVSTRLPIASITSPGETNDAMIKACTTFSNASYLKIQHLPDSDLLTPIKAKTDNLPSDPASNTQVNTRLASSSYVAPDNTNIGNIKSSIDTNLDAKVSTRSTLTAQNVWEYGSRVLTGFGTLISDIWSAATRTLSGFSFTVSTNSDANISSIKSKTDNLPSDPASESKATTNKEGIITAFNNTGNGLYKIIFSVNDGTTSLENVQIRLIEGENIFDGETNNNGQVEFSLNSATYTVLVYKSGYQYSPTTLTVSKNDTVSISMNKRTSSITPSNPENCIVTGTIYDSQLALVVGGIVTFTLESTPNKPGIYKENVVTATSNSFGQIQIELIQGAIYTMHYDTKKDKKIYIPYESTFEISNW